MANQAGFLQVAERWVRQVVSAIEVSVLENLVGKVLQYRRGRLFHSIRPKVKVSATQVEGSVRADRRAAPYANIWEYEGVKKVPLVAKNYGYRAFPMRIGGRTVFRSKVYNRSSSYPPRPFLQPAVDAQLGGSVGAEHQNRLADAVAAETERQIAADLRAHTARLTGGSYHVTVR